MGLVLGTSKNRTIIEKDKRLNGNLSYDDNVYGCILNVIRDDEKILAVNNLYMCKKVVEKKVVEHSNKQQAQEYCMSCIKDWDNDVKCQNTYKERKRRVYLTNVWH